MDTSTFRCRACAADFAPSAIVRVQQGHIELRLCPSCRGPVIREEARSIVPLWRQYLAALWQPFWGWNLAIVGAVGVTSLLAQFAPLLGGAASWALIVAFLFRIVAGVAAGQDSLSEILLDLGEGYSRGAVFWLLARAFSCVFWGALPSLAMWYLLRGQPALGPALLGASLFAAVYTPAAAACVAVTESILLNPLLPLRMIAAAIKPYAQLLGFLLGPGAIWVLVHAIDVEAWWLRAAASLVGVFAATSAAWMVGLFVREYWDELSG